MSSLVSGLKRWNADRNMILGLAKNDFKARYANSFFGIFWAFLQPLVMILVMWFIFQEGLKNEPINGAPFIMWFIPAYLVWSFFSEAIVMTTNAFREYEYLLKQVNFRVGIIPMIKIVSASFIHVVFILFIYVMMMIQKIEITIYSVQVLYYFFCVICLLAALGLLLATLTVFIPDMASLVGIIVQIGFWASPICWSPVSIAVPQMQIFLKLNPMYYICQGYRECFLERVWFWEHPHAMFVFWAEVLLFLGAGMVTFRKMRPYLVDMM